MAFRAWPAALCRQGSAPENGSPPAIPVRGNGSVTRIPASSGKCRESAFGRLRFSLSAAPSPAADEDERKEDGMSSGAHSPAAAPLVPSSSAEPDRSLAGLLDVLDRADAMLPRQPHRPRRSAAYRSSRPAALRPVPPLRSSSSPPPARRPFPPRRSPSPPAPAAAPAEAAAPLPVPAPGGLRGLVHRAALWGA